ncbi:MBG domain-containing protein, partial [Echinicola pacifica]
MMKFLLDHAKQLWVLKNQMRINHSILQFLIPIALFSSANNALGQGSVVFSVNDFTEEAYQLHGYNARLDKYGLVNLIKPSNTGLYQRGFHYENFYHDGYLYGIIKQESKVVLGRFDGKTYELIGDLMNNQTIMDLHFTLYKNKIYFIRTISNSYGYTQLVEYDPSTNQTINVSGEAGLSDLNSSSLVVYDDGTGEKLYFGARSSSSQKTALYSFDGQTTRKIDNFNFSTPEEFIVFNDILYVAASPLNTNGDDRLVAYDGESSWQVFESNPGNSSGKDDIIGDFTIFDNKLFWSAYHYDLAYGGINKKVKLFSMDTDENVTFEHVPNPDYTGGPILMTVVNGELFYSSPHTSNIAYDVYKYINSTSAELISDNKVRINGMVNYDDGLFYFPNNPHYIKKDGSGSYINKEIEGASPRFQSNSQQPVVFEGQISPLFYLKEREVTVIGRATEISPQIELHDIDSYSMGSVKVKITSGLDPADKLTIVSQYGITSNYDADLGELSLNVNSSHTTAQVQDVLRSVRMEGTKEGLRTLLFMGTDAEGNESYLDNEYAKLSANVLVGNFSLLTFPSQPSGMGESTFAGPFLGSFIEEDEILKSVKFKVTDDDTMTPFESLSLAYKEDQYGLFYYDGEIGVSMSIDWESSSYDMTPATLAFKSNDSFNFISFDLRGIDLFNGLDFRVSGKYEGVEKFYFNIDEASNFAGEIIVPNQYVEVEVDEIRISYSGGMGMGMTESYSVDNILFRTLSSYDFDGTLTEGSSISEPVDLPSTLNEVGDHKGIFDFILTDGGGTDGLSMDVSNISFEVSGTAADSTRAKLTYLLNGPDVTDADGEYDADTEKLTFSNLSISIANGGNEHYTLSAYFNDNTFLEEGNTIILNLDGASGITVSEEGTHMQAGSPLSNGTGSVITVKATGWEFTTQPVGSVSGKALTTQPIIAAMDDFGNIDRDFAAAVELTEASAGTLTNATVEAVNGQAIFTNLTYTATADKQSFILTATTDEPDFPAIQSKALIADVLATKLIFTTEPSPLKIYGETAVKFSSVPVVAAVDDQELVDVDYTTNFLLNESGSGKSILTSDGDLDESENSVTLKPVHGQVKFENLTLNYQFKEGFDEDFQLFVSSGTLPLTKSTSINATRDMAEVVKVEVPESKTYGIGDELIIKITFDDPVSVKVDNLPIIRLTVGSQTKIATYQSGANSTTLTFKYIVQEGDMGPGGITILGYEPGSIYQVKNNNPANAALTNIGETKNIHVDGIAPADFLVHFQGGAILNENVANGTISLEDAEMGSTMHYSFKSTAMTDSIYSSLTVTSIYQQVNGLDLRSIPDGAVELLVWLEDAGGNTGKGKRLSLNKKTNTPPQISKLSLTGDLVIGESLTAKYDFADGEKDDENGTVYEWYRAKTANGTDRTKIDGAFLKVYTLKEADRGYFIQVEVKPGDGQVYGEKVISEYIGAIKASQTITFEPIAERTYGGNTFVLGAKYTDQNKEISYSASHPGLVNITGNSAEIIGAGELIITATQAGDAQTLAADAKTQKLIIQKAPLNISVNSDKKVYGAQDPNFSVAYSGFVGEDTAEDLSGVLNI